MQEQFKQAIRDAVNRPSRKPFTWGGLAGYQQLCLIGDALHRLVDETQESTYLRRLLAQVTRALTQNRTLAEDLQAAHTWLGRITGVLAYRQTPTAGPAASATRGEVTTAMRKLLAEFQPDGKRQPAQTVLYDTLYRTWNAYGSELLHCYDIPALPPDNLALEALFSRLRRQQRRISGRKSTQELSVSGHYQVLFRTQSEQELLQQLRTVPLAHYQQHRQRLQQAHQPRRFLYRLHRNPQLTLQHMTDAYRARKQQLAQANIPDSPLSNTS